MWRLFFLLGLLLFLDLYSFQALKEWLRPYSLGSRRLGYGIFWGLSLLAVIYLVINLFEWNEGWSKTAKTYGRSFVFLVYICKVPVVGVLLLDDFRRLITAGINYFSAPAAYDVSRSRFMSTLGLLLGGLPLATLSYGIVRNAYRYQKKRISVPVEGLAPELEGLKIIHISDIHSGSWTRITPVQQAIEMINEEQADLICFTGDLVNNEAKEMLPFVDMFKQLKAKHGVYSVLGNHDYADYVPWESPEAKQANMEALYATHREMGWDLLRDENRNLQINGQAVSIIGVENWSAAMRFPKKGNLQKAHVGSEGNCKILLSHDPTHWEAQVQDYKDIDITLSGHTHGFQFGIEIPGLRWSPAQYVYKQWAGLYRAGRQHLYVNRGLGFLGYPGRVGILPEVTVLELRKA